MIREKLKVAIRSLSVKHSIKHTELRIRISKPKDSLMYEIMKNSEVLEVTNVATALNLNSIVAYMVGNKLNTIIDSISIESGIDMDKLNVRIYTKDDDCEPLLYLFKEKDAVKQLSLDAFV